MKAKTYLREYERARKRIVEIEELIKDLEDQSTNVTQALDQERVQTSPQPDRIGLVVAKMSDLKAELEEREASAENIKREVIRTLIQLEDPDYQKVLRLRYIDCLGWGRVIEEMSYSDRAVYYIHGRALAEVEKIIN